MSNIQKFLEQTTTPILFGGAIGTELQRRNVQTKLPLWSAKANFTDQKILQEIYEDYLNAGVNLTITNTFRTTEWTLKKSKENLPFNAFDLTQKAVRILQSAIQKTNPKQSIFIGGCIAPLEDCYEPEKTPPLEILKTEHKKNVQQLLQAGKIDFILAETQNSGLEAKVICEIAKANKIPFMVSFVNQGENLLNGEPLKKIIDDFTELGALAILLNCRPPKEITKGLLVFQKYCKIPYGAYANGVGRADKNCGWSFETEGSPDIFYAQEAKKWLNLGAKIIGGCCGTTPETMQELRKKLLQNQ